MQVLLAQINPTIGDLEGNCLKIIEAISFAKSQHVDLIIFPELALTGYPPEDLLLLPDFIDALQASLERIREATKGICAIVGTPRLTKERTEKPLYNSAAIFQDGVLLGFQDKSLLPTYDVFDERRYFEPSNCFNIWEICGKKVAVTICEDIWQHSSLVPSTKYLCDPIKHLLGKQIDVLVNLSASPYSLNQFQRRLKACSQVATTLHCPILYCNQVGGNDGLIFDGRSMCVGADGRLLKLAAGFEEDLLYFDLAAQLQTSDYVEHSIENLYHALVLGVRDYFRKQNLSKAVLGLSGGIDSALVACIATDALGSDHVLGLAMPSRYSSESSLNDAQQLARNLNIPFRVISIEDPFQTYLNVLDPYFEGKPQDVTEENLQSRIRSMFLMAFSNKFGYILLSTGNKSELAMGYATLYGDMSGGLGVLSDISKKQVYALAQWINQNEEVIPKNSIEKPPSAELRPNQLDSDTLPAYEIIDTVLEDYVEEHKTPEEISKTRNFPLEVVNDLIKKIHKNEYKRRQAPLGLRVTEKAFSFGRRFPIVQKWR